jgi:hypothetical protein
LAAKGSRIEADRPIEKREAKETARRISQRKSAIFGYAIASAVA